MKTFEEAWAEMVARGYQLGPSAMELVQMGWGLCKAAAVEQMIAAEHAERIHTLIKAERCVSVDVCLRLSDPQHEVFKKHFLNEERFEYVDSLGQKTTMRVISHTTDYPHGITTFMLRSEP